MTRETDEALRRLEVRAALYGCQGLISEINAALVQKRFDLVHVLAQRLAVQARVIQRATAAEEPRA